jgi:glyoxylate carboligase
MLKALALAAALAFAVPAFAQTADDVNTQIDTVLGPHDIYQTAIERIQKALADRDVAMIGGYIAFGEPIMVNGAEVVITDEAELEANFDELFNETVVAAVTGQDYAKLFVSSDGIMFGNGELWITGVCDDDACEFPFINIISINNK